MDANKAIMKMSGLTNKVRGIVNTWVRSDSTQAQIIDWNVYQMEKMGEDSMGNAFGDYSDWSKAVKYPEEKAAIGAESRFINLHFEGGFHKSIGIDVAGSRIKIKADDDKTPLLIEMFGEDILGLNDEHFDELVYDLAQQLGKELTTYFT